MSNGEDMRPQVTIIDVRPAGFDRFGGPAHRPDIRLRGSEETDLDGS